MTDQRPNHLPASEDLTLLTPSPGSGVGASGPDTGTGAGDDHPTVGDDATAAEAPSSASPVSSHRSQAPGSKGAMARSHGVGDEIGPYALVEVLGEGAFGTVFRAEQSAPVRRAVALKILKRGMDTEAILRRFDAEKQALAMMDHAGIATVYDAGVTEGGLPYFVMELVQGEPITRFCDRYRLTINERLSLVRRLCEALQHAHQKGVIHRDIKPSNVLVVRGEAGASSDSTHGSGVGSNQPKLIDFGVAKATRGSFQDELEHTRAGQPIGTPLYMSPEQTGRVPGGVDTRSDIYSVGVLLYELLVGVTPMDRSKFRTVAQQMAFLTDGSADLLRPSARSAALGDQVEAVASARRLEPRRLATRLRGDLDWIVMKCLETDPARRYETAMALADDIARHLEHAPVRAGRPSAGYRFRKFLRRRWPQVTVGTVIALSLVLGLAGTAVGLKKAEDRSRRLQATLDFFSSTLAGRGAAGAATTSWSDTPSVTLGDALRASDLDVGTAFAGAPDLAATVRELIGLAQLRAGEFDGAVVQLRLAHRARAEAMGEQDEATTRLLLPLAEAMVRSGDIESALATAKQAYQTNLTARGPNDVSTRAAALWAGRWHAAWYRLKEAEAFLDAATAGNANLADPIALAAEAERVGVLVSEARLEEAERSAQSLLRAIRQGAEVGEAERLRLVRFLGYVQILRGRFGDAVSTLSSDVARSTPDDGSDRVRRRLIAWATGLSGDVDAARLEFEALLGLEEQSPGPVFREVFARLYFADVLIRAGLPGEGLEQIDLAKSKYADAELSPDPDSVWAFMLRARAALETGDAGEASGVLGKAREIAAAFPEHSLFEADLLLLEAKVARADGRETEAASLAERSRAIAESRFGRDHPTARDARGFLLGR